MVPVNRKIDADVPETSVAIMEGVEHLGQYVFEMTKAKVEALKAGGGVLPPLARQMEAEDDEDEEDVVEFADGEEEEMEQVV